MKKIYFISVLLTGLSFLFFSCSEEGDNNTGSMSVNGSSYVLSYGLVTEAGLSKDSSYMNYWIRFQSSEGNTPSHFIVFKLYSLSTEEIGEGNYRYDFMLTEAGVFSWVKTGFDLQYDDNNELIAGTVLLDYDMEEGSLVITKQGDEMNFEFNIIYTSNSTKYTVTVEFSGTLHEGNVYYTELKRQGDS